MNEGLKTVGRLAMGLLVVLVLAFSYLLWNVNQPPFRLEKLQLLQKGMSKQQVKQILGEPSDDFNDHWAYSRPLSWPIVYIYYDERGLFKESVYDY